MTQDERNKLYVARYLIDGKMSISEAAEVLDLSERQVKRIKKARAVSRLCGLPFHLPFPQG